MRLSIDGVQRRQGLSTALVLHPAPPSVPVVSRRPNGVLGLDGMVRRAPTSFAAPSALALSIAPPASRPLSQPNSWYLHATLAVATIGIAAASISIDAGHVRAIRLPALLSQIRAAQHSPAVAKPATVKVAAVNPATAKAAAATAATQAMQGVINQQTAIAGVPTGIVAIDLNTGAVASSNADTVFTSASLYKLFVATVIYRGIDAGTINYSDAAGDTGMSVQACLNAMITVSSNPCGEALGAMVGWQGQNANLNALGFTHTQLSDDTNEQTSPSDVALLLHKLYDGSLMSAGSTTAFINLLKGQQVNDRLPVGLPAGVTVAHKTGDLNGLAHDAGIVYAPSGNYIVVAMSGPWSSTGTAYSWFAGMSDSLYNSLTAARATKTAH